MNATLLLQRSSLKNEMRQLTGKQIADNIIGTQKMCRISCSFRGHGQNHSFAKSTQKLPLTIAPCITFASLHYAFSFPIIICRKCKNINTQIHTSKFALKLSKYIYFNMQ